MDNKPSMKKSMWIRNWSYLLYASIALLLLGAINLFLVVVPIPSNIPLSAVNGLWINIAIKMIILITLLWIINKRKKGDYKDDLLVITGGLTIMMSFLIIDGVAAYYNEPTQHAVSISMMITAIFDFVAGLMILAARYFGKYE